MKLAKAIKQNPTEEIETMTELEHKINELEKKKESVGLTPAEKAELERLQDEWIENESSRFGQCLSCHI